MAELTPEERQRIYEEEKARVEARAQIEGQTKAKSKLNPNVGCGTVFGTLAVIAFIWYMVDSFSSKPSPPPAAKTTSKAAPIVKTHPLTVVTNKYSINEYGYYEVVGEVTNKSSKTFQFVQVKAEFLNAADVVVGTDMTYACAEDYILPGGKESFKMMGTNQRDYKSVRVFIDDYSEVR